ncbi:TIGR03557 family F420-dependent LLM class oxidoreductase [Haloarculaceae archaeon H-GB2-1]|nr:TIGR03557 family F420-dependent LLM class oxidoreductase [Haloarculaceae archaeon H-GB2-1]
MPELGYALSSEEHGPDDLVDYAVRAESVGFEHALLSDHYHPWVRRQGESPFVWSTLGGIARETESLQVGTGVTCPIKRLHPALVAQASATAASMFDDRFFLGVGTGENLNEHVVGGRWPPHPERLAMLEEAVGIIRDLWTGEERSHHGEYFDVENATLFTVPDETPPLYVAAGGRRRPPSWTTSVTDSSGPRRTNRSSTRTTVTAPDTVR